MAKVKTKYTLRKDGTIQYSTTYKGHRKYFYGKSDREIDKKVDAWKIAIDNGTDNIRTFSKLSHDYMVRKYPELSINTLHGYDVAIRRCNEQFGDLLVNQITPQMVYQFLDKLKAQQFSSKVISNTKSVLKGILDMAFIAQEIPSNPCNGIPAIKGKSRNPRQPASEEDLKKIEKAKNESLVAKMFYFILFTGARRGEAAALQMKDIDLENKTARVHQTLAYGNDSKPTIKDCPKTEAGLRYLELTDNVLEILPTYDDPKTFIFYPDGFPTRRGQENQINTFRRQHDIECTLHQLRHSYASMLHSAGTDVKDAQALLGHANISTTQDVYTHIEQSQKDRVRSRLNEYIKTQLM